MRRRSRFLAVFILVAVVSAAAGSVIALGKQPPAFYTADHSRYEAAERSSALMTRVQDLQNDIRTKPEWAARFAAEDLNCFCHEMFADRTRGLASLLPENCHTPRLAIDGDKVLVGFTYGNGFWSSVVWMELKFWLPRHDTNVIAVEIVSFNAGRVPMSAQSLLEGIRESVHDANIDVSWYRHDGRPVGLFRFYANQLRPATQIHTFKVEEDTIAIAGRTRLESTAGRE